MFNIVNKHFKKVKRYTFKNNNLKLNTKYALKYSNIIKLNDFKYNRYWLMFFRKKILKFNRSLKKRISRRIKNKHLSCYTSKSKWSRMWWWKWKFRWYSYRYTIWSELFTFKSNSILLSNLYFKRLKLFYNIKNRIFKI